MVIKISLKESLNLKRKYGSIFECGFCYCSNLVSFIFVKLLVDILNFIEASSLKSYLHYN